MNKLSFVTGQKNVTTSGTPVQLHTEFPVEDGIGVVIKAKAANTGTITVGNSSANALNSGTSHFKLQANQALTIQVTNLNAIWLDCTVNGEGVEYAFEF